MYMDECEQLAIDNNWSLARTNACHIKVQNEEMGDIRDEIITIQQDISIIRTYQGFNMWIWGIIGGCIIILVLKKMWGTNGLTKK